MHYNINSTDSAEIVEKSYIWAWYVSFKSSMHYMLEDGAQVFHKP